MSCGNDDFKGYEYDIAQSTTDKLLITSSESTTTKIPDLYSYEKNATENGYYLRCIPIPRWSV